MQSKIALVFPISVVSRFLARATVSSASNSPSQGSTHPDDHFQSGYVTP